MSRYIDADKAPDVMKEMPLGKECIRAVMKLVIDRLPTEDVKADTVKKMAKILLDDITLALESNYKVIKEHADKDSEPIRELVTRVRGKIDALRGIEGLILSTVDEMLEEGK